MILIFNAYLSCVNASSHFLKVSRYLLIEYCLSTSINIENDIFEYIYIFKESSFQEDLVFAESERDCEKPGPEGPSYSAGDVYLQTAWHRFDLITSIFLNTDSFIQSVR